MEAMTTVSAKLDEKASQVIQDCLGLPTILRQILRQFSTTELIKLSVVNKLWNFEARSVMKERGNLSAQTSSATADDVGDTCQKLVAFASDLENMRVIPFSGINIHMYHRYAYERTSNGSLDPRYKVILSRLPWKYFGVSFGDEWPHCKNCPALVLVKKILENYCWVLQELSLQYGREDFYRNIFEDRSLPCLKILKVTPGDYETMNEPLTSGFIRSLVTRAPNLEELHVDGEINFTENILQGRPAVLLVATSVFRPLVEEVCEELVGSLRAHTMEIYLENEELDPDFLNRFLPMVLVASRTTLTNLYIDLPFFGPLMHYGICLENVSSLQIDVRGYGVGTIEPARLELSVGASLTCTFRKLDRVTMLYDCDREQTYNWPKQV